MCVNGNICVFSVCWQYSFYVSRQKSGRVLLLLLVLHSYLMMAYIKYGRCRGPKGSKKLPGQEPFRTNGCHFVLIYTPPFGGLGVYSSNGRKISAAITPLARPPVAKTIALDFKRFVYRNFPRHVAVHSSCRRILSDDHLQLQRRWRR